MLPFISITLFLIFALLLTGCNKHESKSTQTTSATFSTNEAKVDFIQRYVTFRREYTKLEFNIDYLDNSTGLVPGPSDWDIRIIATVPEHSLSAWHIDLTSTPDIDTSWMSSVPNTLTEPSSFTWYADDSKIIGIDVDNSRVAYRNHSR
ncbi:hypothetical protein [Rubritalea sp.]|uniref:hypothetical protein n=1 Tax=Rubritalea sp. TaxID=2109375 RepID=UPI003EF3956E